MTKEAFVPLCPSKLLTAQPQTLCSLVTASGKLALTWLWFRLVVNMLDWQWPWGWSLQRRWVVEWCSAATLIQVVAPVLLMNVIELHVAYSSLCAIIKAKPVKWISTCPPPLKLGTKKLIQEALFSMVHGHVHLLRLKLNSFSLKQQFSASEFMGNTFSLHFCFCKLFMQVTFWSLSVDLRKASRAPAAESLNL